MSFRTSPNYDGHEEVAFLADRATGLAGVIAIHSTELGPAFGGCRCRNYPSPQDALDDALRLSQGMSFKNAMAGLPAGGGKAVLFEIGAPDRREAVFEAFGAEVEKLGGRYVTAEDAGTSVADMQAAARRTRHVAGLPSNSGLAGGDPSPWTARGVYLALKAALPRKLAGARVAVQGLGSVGFKLCALLHAAGARLTVADIDGERTLAAQRAFGADVASVDGIYAVEADVFSPNALGAVLNSKTIPELGAPLVCGGANNQLASTGDGARLMQRGVVYVPDYVANAGGIINVMAERFGEPVSAVEDRLRQVPDRVRMVLDLARADRRPANEVADQLARERLHREPVLSVARATAAR